MAEISDQKFLKAYEMASNTGLKFPPDVMLRFYAFYKRATLHNGFYNPTNEEDLRNGFKANALLQVKSISQEDAKKLYVEMVEKHIGKV